MEEPEAASSPVRPCARRAQRPPAGAAIGPREALCLSGMMTIPQLLEAAWEGAIRNELMRALPTELARKLAANPRFRQAPASSLIIVGVRPRQ